jgi:hypothetical protein
VVIPTWDRTLPTVVACLDETLRTLGGAPTYGLTDNERTVTIDRVAGIAVRHPELVAAGRHYGLQIVACQPADPESKGGSEATVRIAKADLVPTEANPLDAYASFGALRAAADAFCETVNAREHRETRQPPVERLAAERRRLHPLPAEAHTIAFGLTRAVDGDATLRFGSARYSVPHQLVGERVWVRVAGDELIVTHAAEAGARGGAPSADHPRQPAHRRGPLSRAHDRSPPSAAAAADARGARVPRAGRRRRALAHRGGILGGAAHPDQDAARRRPRRPGRSRRGRARPGSSRRGGSLR